MAQEVKVLLICDATDDRHEADQTVALGLHGQGYEIDLCADHAKALEESMGEWINLSRRASGGARKPSRGRTTIPKDGQPPYDADVVRRWAKNLGVPISDRGRISPTTIKKWRDAGSPAA